MICDQLTSLIGFECCPLTAAGDVALISTPFQFQDGEGIPVYVELANGQVRFFDDGGTILHFLGRGVRLDDKRRMKWLVSAAESNGAQLTDTGEVEVWSSVTEASVAFAKYVAAMMAVSAWERDQEGVAVDTALFVDEVVMALRANNPRAEFDLDPPPLTGVSGQVHKFDLTFDGHPVIATSPHPNAVSANLRKMVDVRGLVANTETSFLVVIDDRVDPDAADREARVLQAVSRVVPFRSLEQAALPVH